MSYTTKVIYTRPNAGVSLHTPSTDFTNLINSYFDSGKIEQKPVLEEDGLTSTYTMVFKDLASFDEFKDEPTQLENFHYRQTYCNDNSISYSLETDE